MKDLQEVLDKMDAFDRAFLKWVKEQEVKCKVCKKILDCDKKTGAFYCEDCDESVVISLDDGFYD
jgi:hypothetical protein